MCVCVCVCNDLVVLALATGLTRWPSSPQASMARKAPVCDPWHPGARASHVQPGQALHLCASVSRKPPTWPHGVPNKELVASGEHTLQ